MTTGMFMLLFNSPVANAAPKTDDLKKDMIALEFFLQDKKDHKKHCPKLKWEQPDIEVYKKKPKSHLPQNCKK